MKGRSSEVADTERRNGVAGYPGFLNIWMVLTVVIICAFLLAMLSNQLDFSALLLGIAGLSLLLNPWFRGRIRRGMRANELPGSRPEFNRKLLLYGGTLFVAGSFMSWLPTIMATILIWRILVGVFGAFAFGVGAMLLIAGVVGMRSDSKLS